MWRHGARLGIIKSTALCSTKLHILSHRGLWHRAEEKNTLAAFGRSLTAGFGLETDVRDHLGTIVVSHDPASSSSPAFEALLGEHQRIGPDLPLALNIKADGLQSMLKAALERFGTRRYFVFDMSVPDTLGYLNLGLRAFTRQSEYETSPPLYDRAEGVWIDGFHSDWVTEDTVAGHLGRRKRVCLVSPELHGRAHLPFWHRLRAMPMVASDDLMLCTDFPEAARELFDG